MIKNKSMNSDGIVIILSYPDTVVRPAYWESFSRFWTKIGIGSEHAVQAGHTGFLLIKKNEPEIKYFDFGRYITSYGNGRVRSFETDPELYIPLKATFNNNTLTNLTDILLWLERHPEKTHGKGRLIASMNHKIDFDTALNFIHQLIDKKELPYGVFLKRGSNCARFVTDTMINSCTKKRIQIRLKCSYLLTPSPIGNILKGKTIHEIYEVQNQKIKEYKNRSILREYKENFFNKFTHQLNLIGTELPDINTFNLENATWLSGIGSGAWFKIEEQLNTSIYRISRYTKDGNKDFESFFDTHDPSFNFNQNYNFIHPTSCKEIHIKQREQEFVFKQIQL
ncbi:MULTISPECIES: DUF6695 family protein [unclassified Polaribacter]|uniref:DUF6695 family protein n=1 Tax=unclassified Polaribacter TaxID=196858 RepID=UPI0011BED75C|nr:MULTISPECIES: DUF6695 family protein [unclassified Polaribacter]TXD51474.1 hypothetical protein ES043_11815 [Polaribacter sp. IC063]TXD61798.1 hypothetical protein ES044_03505 [Polaribacter sp. IC066]